VTGYRVHVFDLIYEHIVYLKVWHVIEPATLLAGECGRGMCQTQGEHKWMQTFSHESYKGNTTCKT